MNDSARRDRRFPARQALLVRCETWSEFAQLYATDISQGGMFIVTDEQLPILSEVEIDLRLPEAQSVQLRAEIVHVLGPDQAVREGRHAGIGVHFVDLTPAHRQQIVQLVEFARWEGDNPNASFAGRMFELSTSLPPSKVLSALPPDGGDARSVTARISTRVASASEPPATPRPSGPAREKRSRAPGAEDTSQSGTRPSRPTAAPQNDPGRQSAAPAEPAQPSKPLDVAKLKLGMTHLVHKRLEQGIKTFEELLRETPGDRQASQWLYVAHARLRLKNNDPDGAAEHYQKALELDENNHEARKFVREHHKNKRLNSIPFGRYFVKKP